MAGPVVATLATNASRLTGGGVPAGSYYVRIRAMHALGSGETSAEHVVVVQ